MSCAVPVRAGRADDAEHVAHRQIDPVDPVDRILVSGSAIAAQNGNFSDRHAGTPRQL